MTTVPLLAKIGLLELAFGTLSGWVLVAAQEKPELLRKLGFVQIRPLIQAHTSILMMGTAVTAAGIVVGSVPTWIVGMIVVGSVIDPLLFVPLAWGLDRHESMIFRATAVIAFVALSIGFVALAGIALMR